MAWSHLGLSYSPLELVEALKSRSLIELQAMIRPSEDLALYRSEMAGWTNNRNIMQLLEFLVKRGEVAVSGRSGGERRLQSLGIARARGPECPVEPMDVGEVGEPSLVEGVPGTWRVDPSLLGQPFTGRTALLSPFDRLIHDRKRTIELFKFDYQLEIYKPAAKRRWRYFALPILHGDRMVGKLDAHADRTSGVLRIDAVHQDIEFTPTTTDDVDREIQHLAQWLKLDLARSD